MKRVFNRIEHNTDSNLSLEMIDPQMNDYVVNAIKDCFDELSAFIKDNSINNTYSLFDNRDAYTIIKKLDIIISKRFGINFKHTGTTMTEYGALTVPPKNFSILNTDIEEIYQNTTYYLKMKGLKDSNALPTEEIKNSDYNHTDMLFRWKKSMDALEKAMNTTGVVIDLKKAVIYGLPDTYHVFLTADFCSLVNELELDSDELTAVLLHEIGHAFTHIEYSYRTVNNTSVLMDTIKENVERHNKTYKESLLLAYKELFKEVPVTLEKANTVTVVLATVERFIKEHNYINDSLVASTDSEQLADQFAGRFGMGAALITSLTKIYKKYPDQQWYVTMASVNLVYALQIFAVGLISGVGTGVILATVTISVLLLSILSMITYSIFSYTTGGNVAVVKTYDDNKQRLIRVRNELVRNIRSSKLDNNVIKDLIAQVDSVSLIINALPDEKPMFIDNFFQTMTTKGKRMLELQKLEQITESLMENDLHIAAAKIKTLL